MHNKPPLVFDRNFHLLQLKKCKMPLLKQHFLLQEIAEELQLRLADFATQPSTALFYGLPLNLNLPNTNITYASSTQELLAHAGDIFDEELIPDFSSHKYDLIISNFTLHYINDVIGSLVQYRRILNIDKGIFIATIFGPKTLHQLKDAFLKLDMQLFSGVYNHIIPFIDPHDGATIMQRAGFKNVVADSFEINIEYQSLSTLLRDIKSLGQGNALTSRSSTILPKSYFQQLEQVYQDLHQLQCTFEIVTLTGLYS